MKKTIIFLFNLYIILFISCKKNDSSNSIEIEDFSAYKIGFPTVDELKDNDTLYVTANIVSKSFLQSYKIDIHFAGDNHTHSFARNIISEEFTFIEESNVNTNINTLALRKEIILAPSNGNTFTSGEYHVVLTVLDINGTSKSSNEGIEINEVH